MIRLFAALALSVAIVAAPGAFAQDGSTSTPEAAQGSIEEVVEAARQSGATVIVIDRNAAPAGDAADPAAALDQAAVVREELAATLATVPHAPQRIAETFASASEGASPNWLWWAVVLSLVMLVVAGAVVLLVRRQLDKVLARVMAAHESVPAYRTTYVLLRTVFALFCDVLFLAVCIAVVLVVVPHEGPARATALALAGTITYFLVIRDIFVSVFLPDRPRERLLNLDDDTARGMLRGFVAITVIATVLLGFGAWLRGLGADERLSDLMRILASLIAPGLLIVYLLVYRRTIAALVRTERPYPSLARRVAASLFVYVLILYLAVAVVVNIEQIVTSSGFRVGAILAPILGAMVALFVYGVLVIALARRFAAHQATLQFTGAAAGAGAELEPVPDGEVAAVAPVNPVTVWRMRWQTLTQHLAGIAAVLLGILFAAMVLFPQTLASSHGSEFLGLAFVLFATYGIYQAIRTWIDGTMEDEIPSSAVHSEDGMGPGASRLATLLPLLRNVLIVSVVAIAAMVVLAAMGVNVGPLFAGAGVVGLAIGFGAQTLIRDVFSGAFFLVDDAFRRGEYLDVGGVMGSVEKISVRSFQLRHHNGPLHTIPFGEIKQLTNFSRDWVIMKLPLRIKYGTDVEKVRKLVKKLGAQMAADPEIGPLFLEPLKSQGVVEMEDSAMIMRVKFMTKPGDQFVARRHVFTQIGELFEREGIEFAHREVTVRIASDGPIDDDTARAAAGAARSALEAERAG